VNKRTHLKKNPNQLEGAAFIILSVQSYEHKVAVKNFNLNSVFMHHWYNISCHLLSHINFSATCNTFDCSIRVLTVLLEFESNGTVNNLVEQSNELYSALRIKY